MFRKTVRYLRGKVGREDAGPSRQFEFPVERVKRRVTVIQAGALALIAGISTLQTAYALTSISSATDPGVAPEPEPIDISRLPLPPRPNADGVCEAATGCVGRGQIGGFLPNGDSITLTVEYEGAPEAPDPRSIFSGPQVVLLKVDGTTFPDGEPWKCLTCGMPTENMHGGTTPDGEHPQPFPDGKRIYVDAGKVLDCSPHPLHSTACTPDKVHIYPIRWNVTADGSGSGGSMRETRLHPDGVHMGWSKLVLGPLDADLDPENPSQFINLDQFAYFGRLVFNPNPTTGEPLAPRYDLENVTILVSPEFNSTFIKVDPNNPAKLIYDQRGAVGEFRGFNGDGSALLGMCHANAHNTDICATDLMTADSERRTADPSYIDPVALSPDNEWTAALEVRQNDRFWYIAGLPGVPPINHIIIGTAGAVASGYRDGGHRLFQPYLLDRYPERPGYQGQRINACTPPITEDVPGSVCDLRWGTRADPVWSPDGTKIVYYQYLEQAPDCQGVTGFDCTSSTEPHGHTWRIMLAELTSRTPLEPRKIDPVPDEVPWGTPYEPGDPDPIRSHVPTGVYTLDGRHSGSATVTVVETPDKAFVLEVTALYDNYSDDGRNFLNGTETVSNEGGNAGPITFHSALTLSDAEGNVRGGRFTSPDGFTVSAVNAILGEIVYEGYMTTVLDGKTYHPPVPTR